MSCLNCIRSVATDSLLDETLSERSYDTSISPINDNSVESVNDVNENPHVGMFESPHVEKFETTRVGMYEFPHVEKFETTHVGMFESPHVENFETSVEMFESPHVENFETSVEMFESPHVEKFETTRVETLSSTNDNEKSFLQPGPLSPANVIENTHDTPLPFGLVGNSCYDASLSVEGVIVEPCDDKTMSSEAIFGNLYPVTPLPNPDVLRLRKRKVEFRCKMLMTYTYPTIDEAKISDQ